MPRGEPERAYDPPRTVCSLCGSSRLLHRLTDFRGHRIDACEECGVELMNPQYSDDDLRRFYAGYINLHPDAEHGGSAPAGADGRLKHRQQPEVRRTGKRRALQLLARHCTGRRILMVGCGDGLEIRAARETGWQPEGYDVDEAVTAEVAGREGVVVHCGPFESLVGRVAPFDALFLDQVIEHPKEPGRYLDICRDLLAPGGVLYLGTPNIASISNRLKTLADRLRLRRRPGRHYNTKHHLTFFRPAVLVRHLRERLGLEILHLSGSLKPQKNPLGGMLARRYPLFDSSFVVIARRPASAANGSARARNGVHRAD